MADVIWTKPAKLRLKSIYEYFKPLAPQAAKRLRTRILHRAARLRHNPEMGAREFLLEHLPRVYRYLVEGNYKIVYRYDGNSVFVVDVFDCRQDPQKLAQLKDET